MHVVVDTNGDKYYVFSDKVHNYDIGGVYDVTYKLSQFKTRNVDSAVRSRAAPAPAQPRAPTQHASSNTYRETSATDAERMMVTALVRAGVQAGSVALNEQDLTNAINDVRAAWRNTFGAPAVPAARQAVAPQRRADDDMNDTIPF